MGFERVCERAQDERFCLVVERKAVTASQLKPVLAQRAAVNSAVLQKSDRLRHMRDFALLSQRGRVVFTPLFTLRFRQSHEKTRVGFVASTKLFKTAVSRNRVKRRMREVLRAVRSSWPEEMDLLFILKPGCTSGEFQDLIASVLRSFEKIPDALKQPPRIKNVKARRKTSVVYRGS